MFTGRTTLCEDTQIPGLMRAGGLRGGVLAQEDTSGSRDGDGAGSRVHK